MAHYAVHSPFETDERFISHYTDPNKSQQARAFATLIEGMDKSLGDILDKLEDMGIAENTLIIFWEIMVVMHHSGMLPIMVHPLHSREKKDRNMRGSPCSFHCQLGTSQPKQ